MLKREAVAVRDIRVLLSVLFHQLAIKRRYDRLTHKLGTDLTIISYKAIERLTARERGKCAYVYGYV